MLKRILTAVVALAVFFPVLYFSETAALPITLAVLSVIAVWELFGCTGTRRSYALFCVSLLMAAGVPIAARYLPGLLPSCAAALVCAALIAEVLDFDKFDPKILGLTALQSAAAIFGIGLIVLVRDREPYRYLLIFIAAWATDTFAYFSGMLFGKRKLCPHISPKKTVAGAIGGVVGGAIGGLIVYCIFKSAAESLVVFMPAVIYFIIIGLIGSVLTEIGDLFESGIKRKVGIKDMGKIMPGHGGVMDRLDSALAVAPVIFFLLYFTGLSVFSL